MPNSEVTISPMGLRIIQLLAGNPPRTAAALAKSLGMTRPAANLHVDELIAAGFVVRTVERTASPGRPRNLFAATDAALALLFARGHREILPILWKAISEIGGEELLHKVMVRLGEVLAEKYRSQIQASDPEQRLKELMHLMQKEGVLIETVEHEGCLTIRRRSCPFATVADEKFAVCTLDTDLFSAILGCPVRKVACRRHGEPCCVFEVVR